MTIKPAYIVIDTNVLISAGLLPHSHTAQVLALAVQHFVIAQNQATWHELATRIAKKKLDRYFGTDGRLRHLTKIAQSIQAFTASAHVDVCRDPSDNLFIELALDAGAAIIISGDHDLTTLKSYQGVNILTPAAFYAQYQGRPVH